MSIVALLTAATLALADPPPDLDSLTRVVSGLQSGIKDVEFAFEGTYKTLIRHPGERPPKYNFQGRFAYRGDTSLHLDVYQDYPDPNQSMKRTVWGYLARTSTLEALNSQIDRDKLPRTPTRTKTGLPFLEREDMPLRLWMMPVFLCILRDTNAYRTLRNYPKTPPKRF